MKTRNIDKLWFALAAVIVALLLMSGCTTSKNIQKQQTENLTDRTLDEDIKINSDATTKTETRNQINTHIVEEYNDTIHKGGSEISGSVQLQVILKGGKLTTENSEMVLMILYDSISKLIRSQALSKPKDIPVKGKRTIDRHEIIDQTQQKNETSGSSVIRKDQISNKFNSETVNKDVSRTGLPTWLIILFVVAAIVGFAVLIWRLKLF